MPTAFRLVLILIGSSPVFAFANGPIADGLLGVYISIVAAFVAAAMRPIEASHLAGLLRPLAIGAAVPACWMILQVLPMPIKALAHPIWQSAEEALGVSLFGKISVDPGATLIALSRFLTAIGVIFAAAAVSIDRQRAERLQSWLAGVAAVIVAILIVQRLSGFPLFGIFVGARSDILAAVSAIGIVMNCATLVRVIERYETRQGRNEMAFGSFAGGAAVWFVCLFVCAIGVALSSISGVFVAACGVVTLLLTVLIRRIGLGVWPSALIAGAASIAAVALVVSNWGGTQVDVALHFANAPAPMVAITQRMISDAPVAGTGAGTFSALLPIYRDIDDLDTGTTAPTTAAAIVIELGRPTFWIFIGGLALCIAFLLRGALQRGRDSFYPAAAASCLIILVLEAFRDASLLRTAVVIIAAAAIGLGLAQSLSRTGQ